MATAHNPPNSNVSASFLQDSDGIEMRLSEAKQFTKSDSKRLGGISMTLQHENIILKASLDDNNEAATLNPEICEMLGQAPLRCLPMPIPRFFDELVSVLAEYVETHIIDYNQHAMIQAIRDDFARMQALDPVSGLVMDNFRLRKANIELAAGEQKFTFQAVLGEAPHQAVFTIRVPFQVSSAEPATENDFSTSIREFEKTTGGRDLVLEGGIVALVRCQAMAYHPLSAVYVPAFPGVTCTAPHVEIADTVAFYDYDNYLL
ncbi:hypothetical protein HDK90DRAFT_515495 [Phyllosticta capitalensis]|uniref:Uncharacterized protein n=1 Tax=Phyllosticta capitalensis TaxID=121624 RepID=A0ABR1Y937_9PEZI